MADDRIYYEVLVQDALRNVIRAVLTEVTKTGLPGEHHFFITFATTAAGVQISPRLRERFPEQMTIVLQHQFRDLLVEPERFSVTLSFNDVPEKLVIPFHALQVFYDPAAAFEAAFEGAEQQNVAIEEAQAAGAENAASQLHEAIPAQGADVVSLDAFRRNR